MKIKVAFVKFGGLSAGGTERWLQMMAANLPRDKFEVDYYYCDAAPYSSSGYKHANTDPERLRYMQERGVNLIKFKVGAKDDRKITFDWIDTDFWDVFDEKKYDLVQTAKAGPAEYPFYLINKPVVEYVTLEGGPDYSPNIACSIHLSNWQRAEWVKKGGDIRKTTVIPIPANPPSSSKNLREELGIPKDAVVAGFHQRADDNISSEIPLLAFSRMKNPGWHFAIMGGGDSYKKQVREMGLENVHFVQHSGDAKRISEFLNTLDIFAHGRKDGETFGTVFAEAMMHGKPCLSHYSAKGANAQPETMGPGGLFAHNLDEYTEKLKLLYTDSEVRKELGERGKEFAEEEYSVEKCAEKLAKVYEGVLAGKTAFSGANEAGAAPSALMRIRNFFWKKRQEFAVATSRREYEKSGK